ncbi:MAG TPA: G8 domain-containing protein [Flavisolibacter sp.]
MNKFYLLILFILASHFSFAAPIIKSINSGNWNQASTWNLNRIPQNGDTIVLASGNIVTISDDEVLTAPSFLKIYGKLYFQNNNSTLSLPANSFVWVFAGGMIQGVSASEKLRLNNTIIYSGNQEPVYGPMMASVASNGFAAMVNSSSVVLPVKFIDFTVTSRNNTAVIQWSTSGEVSVGRYEVERSIDGSNWTFVSTVSPKGSNQQNNYTYIDSKVSGNYMYYRVKEVDANGNATFTSTSGLRLHTESSQVVIASVSNKLLLQFPAAVNGNVVIRFVNLNGQVLDQQTISNPAGQIVMNTNLKGNCIVSVSNGQDINLAKQIIL